LRSHELYQEKSALRSYLHAFFDKQLLEVGNQGFAQPIVILGVMSSFFETASMGGDFDVAFASGSKDIRFANGNYKLLKQ